MQKVAEPSSVLQAASAKSGIVLQLRHAGQRFQLAVLEQLQRGVERAAGDQVAGRAAVELGAQRRVVFLGRGRLELELDVRVLGLEGRDDLLLPDRQVVVAPALDHEVGGVAPRRGWCRPAAERPAAGAVRRASVIEESSLGVMSACRVGRCARGADRRAPRPAGLRRLRVRGRRRSSTASLMSWPARSQAAAAGREVAAGDRLDDAVAARRRAWRWPGRR